jgi:hypothetical protein
VDEVFDVLRMQELVLATLLIVFEVGLVLVVRMMGIVDEVLVFGDSVGCEVVDWLEVSAVDCRS